MFVSQLMTHDPVTVSMDESVAAIKEMFDSHMFHHLIVVEEGAVVGIISDRDLLRALSPFIGKRDERTADARLLQRHAHQIMTRNPVCVSERTPLSEAMALILAHRISSLPVVDASRRPVGILSWRDVVSWALGRIADSHAA